MVVPRLISLGFFPVAGRAIGRNRCNMTWAKKTKKNIGSLYAFLLLYRIYETWGQIASADCSVFFAAFIEIL